MFPGLAGHLAPIIVNLVFAGLLYMRTQIYRARCATDLSYENYGTHAELLSGSSLVI